MPRGRPMPVVKLTSQIRAQLQAITRSRTLSQAMAQRARIILLAADGMSNGKSAQQLHLSRQTVGKWRKRFMRQSLLGLYDEPKPGAPRSMGDEQIAELVHRTLEKAPPPTPPIGVAGPWPKKAKCPSPAYSECGGLSASSPIARATSPSPPILSLSRRFRISGLVSESP